MFTRTDTEKHRNSARLSINIAPMVTGTLWDRMGVEPILPVNNWHNVKLERAEFRCLWVLVRVNKALEAIFQSCLKATYGFAIHVHKVVTVILPLSLLLRYATRRQGKHTLVVKDTRVLLSRSRKQSFFLPISFWFFFSDSH